jgi:hypothetical protein
MSVVRFVLQIPVSEAQESASSLSGPLSALSRIPSSLSSSHGGTAGYSRINAEDVLDEGDDDEETANEGDVMLRPMRRQSHSEITVAQDETNELQPSPPQPQPQLQQPRTHVSSSFRPPHFPVAAGARRVIQSTMDGVFSNLSAKPRVERPHQEELPPVSKKMSPRHISLFVRPCLFEKKSTIIVVLSI